MKNKNIWKEIEKPLGYFKDNRGEIVDVFYKKDINHVAVIKSEPNILRGNHYHKESTQHMLITKGSLEYWYKPLNSTKLASVVTLREGDFVSTPPGEVHALVIGPNGNEFIVFTEGIRGGCDYESDTYRVDNIVPLENTPG